MREIVVDCEATYDSPWSGVLTEFGAVHLKSRNSFYGKIWDSTPDPKIPAKPVVFKDSKHYNESAVFGDFALWIYKVTENANPVFVSDNPAYDWQWINYYFDKNGILNPFGFSARRIGDFAAGLASDWQQSSKWKQLRVTKHTHNPVDDALGNAEALATLLEGTK